MSGDTPTSKSQETPNALPVAVVCVLHGIYLTLCGYYGAAVIGQWEPSAMHSLYSGAGAGVLLAFCGLLSVSSSYRLYMIGVHIALLMQLVLFAVFAIQAYRSYNDPGKHERFPLFIAMAVGTILALGAMVAFKPSKKKVN